jgi:large subunit ribosomal protein L22
MKVQAKTRQLPISARKLRLVADMVRGKDVVAAQQLLRVTHKKAADMVYSTLKSASANAENNYNLNPKTMRIDEIRVDEGSTLKRMRPRAKGASSAILHRSSHLVITLTDAKPAVDAKAKPAVKAKPVTKEAK